MPEYNLLATKEGWLPEETLRQGLLARFPGTEIAYDLVPRTAFHLYAFIPDPVPGDEAHSLELSLVNTENMASMEDASLEKVAEITVWILANFPAPPGAELMLWYDDDPYTLDPATVTETDIFARFDD